MTLKVATLLVILCEQSAREILTAIDLRNTPFEENFPEIHITYILKTTTKSFHVREVKFPIFLENKQIFPLTCLKQYLKLPENIREDITSVFITTMELYKQASKETIARWIKMTLATIGINTSIFVFHSTRFISTNKAYL